MAVEKVTLSEIESLRSTMPVQVQDKPQKTENAKPEKFYVQRMSDKKIAEFFAPYEYRMHERSEDGSMIFVLCDSFQIVFDDFNVMTSPINNFYIEPSEFFTKFTDICEEARITPDQAIADRLEDEVFKGMPYYVENKKKFIDNNLKTIAKNPEFGKLLKASATKQKHRENYTYLNKTYGDSDPIKIADTLARLNPNK